MAVEVHISQNAQQSDAAAVASQLQALQIAFDSSERKAFEQALEASERRYRDLFDNVLTGVYRITAEGSIVLANPALLRMLGANSIKDARIRRVDPGAYARSIVR